MHIFMIKCVLALVSIMFLSCSNSDGVAGGVTDIGNSVAVVSGRVLDQDGFAVAGVRVLAYYDNWNQTAATDSVENISDEAGRFSVEVDTSRSIVLYAESGDECVLANASVEQENELFLGKRKSLESSVGGANSGFVRIVGTDMKAPVSQDGRFHFDHVPPGDIVMVFVQGEKPLGYVDFKTTDDREALFLPPMENRQDDGRFSTTDFGHDMYGVEFGGRNHKENGGEISLLMDGREEIFTMDNKPVETSNYVEGISGKALLLEQGQFLDAGEIDLTQGDFTLSLWTKWNGENGADQVLFSQVSRPDSPVVKFQWFFDGAAGKFSIMKSSQTNVETYEFGNESLLPRNQWCYLVLVSEKGKVSMYVNGKIVGSTDFKLDAVGGPFHLKVAGNGLSLNTWNGVLDEVHIEKIAQSPDWIWAIYSR